MRNIKSFKNKYPESCLFYVDFKNDDDKYEEDDGIFITKEKTIEGNNFYIILNTLDSDEEITSVRFYAKMENNIIYIISAEYSNFYKNLINEKIFEEDVKSYIINRLDRMLLPICEKYIFDLNKNFDEETAYLFEDLTYFEGYRNILCNKEHEFYNYYKQLSDLYCFVEEEYDEHEDEEEELY